MQAIPQIISGIVNALVGNIDKIIMAGVKLFVSLIENLPTIIVEIVKAVPQIIAGIVSAFGSLMYKIVEIGGNIVKGLWSGITVIGVLSSACPGKDFLCLYKRKIIYLMTSSLYPTAKEKMQWKNGCAT